MLRDGGFRRLLSMRDITIARAEPRAKPELWFFPVFVLFRPVIDGQIGRAPRGTARAHFSFASRRLRDTRNAGLWPAACFSPVIYMEKQAPRAFAFAGCRCRSASLPHAVTAGARLRD